MYKWLRTDGTVVILCASCSKEQYKNLEIRVRWKATEVKQEFKCDGCGILETISLATSE